MSDIDPNLLVARRWIADAHLTLKMQSVLFSALRGCDTVGKEDASKPIVRAIRSVVLRDAEQVQVVAGFGQTVGSLFLDGDLKLKTVTEFTEDLDHYPVHFVMHIAHACEIIGYKHPDINVREPFLHTYNMIVEAVHMLPESVEHLDMRLSDAPFGEIERARYRNLTICRTEIAWRRPTFRLLVARCVARLLASTTDPAGFRRPARYEETAAVRPMPQTRATTPAPPRRDSGYRD